MSASLALPFSGTAASFTFNVPSASWPAISDLGERGVTLTRRVTPICGPNSRKG